MTELQISLLVIGIAIVLAVFIYNRWQLRSNRKNRPIQPEGDTNSQKTIAPLANSNEERIEPHLSSNEPAAAVISDSDLAATELAKPTEATNQSSLAATEQKAEAPKFTSELADSPAPTPKTEPTPTSNPSNLLWAAAQTAHIDPIIDCVISLRADTSFSSEKLLPYAALLRRAGSKPVMIEGLNLQTKEWEAIRAGQTYIDLQVAVQLANRTGPLNALEFSEFVSGVQRFADVLDAQADFPDMNETVANARELDAFALQCDAQLGMNIISDGAPWSAAYVQTIATRDGLVLARDGSRFTRYFTPTQEDIDKGMHSNTSPVFTLQFANTNFLRDDLTHTGNRQISLNLDVPNAEEDIRPFRLMYEYALNLATRMGAKVVDDNLNPLPESAIDAIEQQLMVLYAKLEARGVPAGSATALRLFSH